jgi:ABC-type enterochelin transport system permease subunit
MQLSDLANWPSSFPILASVSGVAVMSALLTGVLILLYKATAAIKPDETVIRAFLSLLVTLAFIGAVFTMMVRAVPENEGTGLLLGGLIAAFSNVVAYYYNTTKNKPPADEGTPGAPDGHNNP